VFLFVVRSFVGLIPLLAVSVIESKRLDVLPGFKKRFDYYLKQSNSSREYVFEKESTQHDGGRTFLLTIPDETQLRRILRYVLDENEFLSPYGLRSLSKHYEKHPYVFTLSDKEEEILYAPAESLCGMFGGNSNWRGPIWLCINFLLVEALERFVSIGFFFLS
jgi:hypothetical protein